MAEERDEIILALHKYRSVEFAKLAAVALMLAAETHGPEMREAFSKLFDLSALDDMTRRAILTATEAQAKAEAVRQLLVSIGQDLEALEKRMDALAEQQERFRAAFVKWMGAGKKQ